MKLNFKNIHFALFSFVLINGNIIAQSTYKNVDKLATKCSNGHTKSCKKLIDLAKNSSNYWMVRVAAVDKITDQNDLIDIAKSSSNISVGETAVEKISDQNGLIDIAKNSSNYWMVRVAAVEKIIDQNDLIDIAKNEKDWYVKEAAVERITDQNILIDIAKNSSNSHVKEAAVKGITDHNILIDIAKNEKDWYVKEAAVKNINNPNPSIQYPNNLWGNDRLRIAIDKVERTNVYPSKLKGPTDVWITYPPDASKYKKDDLDFVVIYFTISRIEKIHVTGLGSGNDLLTLYDTIDYKYELTEWSVKGIKLYDPNDFASNMEIIEGAKGYLVFKIPKAEKVSNLSFVYYFQESLGDKSFTKGQINIDIGGNKQY